MNGGGNGSSGLGCEHFNMKTVSEAGSSPSASSHLLRITRDSSPNLRSSPALHSTAVVCKRQVKPASSYEEGTL